MARGITVSDHRCEGCNRMPASCPCEPEADSVLPAGAVLASGETLDTEATLVVPDNYFVVEMYDEVCLYRVVDGKRDPGVVEVWSNDETGNVTEARSEFLSHMLQRQEERELFELQREVRLRNAKDLRPELERKMVNACRSMQMTSKSLEE